MNLNVTEVKLHLERWYAAQIIDWPSVNLPRFEVDWRVDYCGALLVQMIQDVFIQRKCIAEYPTTWWDAVKRRFAPQWFLRRWPAHMSHIAMETLYPHVAIPHMKHIIKLHTYHLHPDSIPPTYTDE